MDTDSNLDQLIPLLIEGGVNAIMPCEVQAGNDVVTEITRPLRFSCKMRRLGGQTYFQCGRGLDETSTICRFGMRFLVTISN